MIICPLKDPRRYEEEGDRFDDGKLAKRCLNVQCAWARNEELCFAERPVGCMLDLLTKDELEDLWTVCAYFKTALNGQAKENAERLAQAKAQA